MNCEKCLAMLSNFLDEDVNSAELVAITAHLEKCLRCKTISADLTTILDCCSETSLYVEEPPNSQALWLRISNLIECEQSPLAAVEAQAAIVAGQTKTHWWTRTMERSWQLSFQQMFAAVLGITLIASLLTVVILQNAAQINFNSQDKLALTQSNLFPQIRPNAKSPDSLQRIEIENRWTQQQLVMQYWNQRVESRKTQWNRHLRDAFDRNLQEIDQVVADYKQQLRSHPDDKISEEMLDSALNDKMELLREFSEL